MRPRYLKSVFPILFSTALVVLFFHPVLSGENTFYFRDIHRWFYPMKYFLAQSFQHGNLPFWCSSYFCGAPFLSDIQSGVFYPLSVIFASLPFPLSFNLFICIHFFLGFIFCHLFLKEAGRSTGAALFGATAYGYGGFTIASLNTLNNLTTAIWLPAVLWAFLRTIRNTENLSLKQPDITKDFQPDGKRTAYGVVIFFLVMGILGGEPQLFLMIAGLLFLYAVTMFHNGSWRAAYGQGATIAALGATAILIAIVQLGPTYLDFRMSARTAGFDYEMATRNSLAIQTLKHLVLPLRFAPDFAASPKTLTGFFPGNGTMPWLLTIYPGFLIVPLAIFGILSDFNRKKFFWAVILILSIILALGRNTPVYQWFYKLLPFFRFPEKFMFLAGFCLVVLSAGGLDRLFIFLQSRKIRPGLVFCLLFVTLVADLYAANAHLNPTCEARFYHQHHKDLTPIFNDQQPFRVFVDPGIDQPTGYRNRISIYHARWQLLQLPHLGIISGIDHVDGKTGMELQYQWVIHEILHHPWPEKIDILRAANVKYIISDKPLDRGADLKNRVRRINAIVYEITDSLPRAWMVGQLRPPEKNAIFDIASGAVNPAKTAVVEDATIGQYRTPFFSPIDAIEYLGPGRIRVAVEAPMPAILVLSESFYPGWKVSVDGARPIVPLKLNALFQGVAVEKGQHTVEFIYRPPHFNLFAGISLVAAISIFLFLGVGSKRSKIHVIFDRNQ